jgi:SAM-dependent methyltransferase
MSDGLVIPSGWVPGETWKSRARRLKTGWFEKYAPDDKSGIDIGCQRDPLNHTFRRWDVIFGDGDATFMEGLPDDQFWTVYASHVLEHLDDPVTALKNWYRITKPGGNLIVLVPHRDMYEKKSQPPSNWNHEHKNFFVPEPLSPPLDHVFCLKHVIFEAIPYADLISYTVLDEGYVETPSNTHACGEYSIEAIVRKR